VLTDVGPVEIDAPRDRDGSFEPKIVAKRQRRLSGVDDLVQSSGGTIVPRYPRMTICGSSPSGLTQFVIRSHATTVALADMLDERVTAWAKGLSLPA
jgi:hypothetical protein